MRKGMIDEIKIDSYSNESTSPNKSANDTVTINETMNSEGMLDATKVKSSGNESSYPNKSANETGTVHFTEINSPGKDVDLIATKNSFDNNETLIPTKVSEDLTTPNKASPTLMTPNKASSKLPNNNLNKGDNSIKKIICTVLGNKIDEMDKRRRSYKKELSTNIENRIVSLFGAQVIKNVTNTYSIGIQQIKLLSKVEDVVVEPRRQLANKIKRKLSRKTHYPSVPKKSYSN